VADPIDDFVTAWDSVPKRLDQASKAAEVAAPVDRPTHVDDLERPLRKELITRLRGLGLLARGLGSATRKKVRAAWATFRTLVSRPPLSLPPPSDLEQVDPEGWAALLRVTVLEKRLPDGLGETTLGFRARRLRMHLLGMGASFSQAPRFPALFITLRGLGLPAAKALGTQASAATDAWVAPLLDDVDLLAERVFTHLDGLDAHERLHLEARYADFLERLAYIDTVATGWTPLDRAVDDPALVWRAPREAPEGAEALEAALPEGPVADDPDRDPVPPPADPSAVRPLHPEARQHLMQALVPVDRATLEGVAPDVEDLEAALPTRVRAADLGRLLRERRPSLGLEHLEAVAPRRVELDTTPLEEALDVRQRPWLARMLEKANKAFGTHVLWEGLDRIGTWLENAWDKVVDFFRGLTASDDRPKDKDKKFWVTALKWISTRLSALFQGVSNAVRAVGVWLGRGGRTLEHEGRVIGGFELRLDWDALVFSDGTPHADQQIARALAQQTAGLTLAFDILGAIVDVIIAVATGGGSLAWRLVPMLARAWQELVRTREEARPTPALAELPA